MKIARGRMGDYGTRVTWSVFAELNKSKLGNTFFVLYQVLEMLLSRSNTMDTTSVPVAYFPTDHRVDVKSPRGGATYKSCHPSSRS